MMFKQFAGVRKTNKVYVLWRGVLTDLGGCLFFRQTDSRRKIFNCKKVKTSLILK